MVLEGSLPSAVRMNSVRFAFVNSEGVETEPSPQRRDQTHSAGSGECLALGMSRHCPRQCPRRLVTRLPPVGRPRTAHPAPSPSRTSRARWRWPGARTGVAPAAECPQPSTSGGSWDESCAGIPLQEQPLHSFPCSLLGLAAQARGFSRCIGKTKNKTKTKPSDVGMWFMRPCWS